MTNASHFNQITFEFEFQETGGHCLGRPRGISHRAAMIALGSSEIRFSNCEPQTLINRRIVSPENAIDLHHSNRVSLVIVDGRKLTGDEIKGFYEADRFP